MRNIGLYFSAVEWFVALREYQEDILCSDKIKVKVLNNTWRYWCADPFVFEYEGITYIFMEVYDKIRQRGYIGYRKYQDGVFSNIHICMKKEYHMSYPYIFMYNNNVYMLPECYQQKKLVLYKAVKFPDEWEACETILDNIAVCDTDVLEYNGKPYMLTMEIYGNPFKYDRLSMYHKEGKVWKPIENNPVVVGEEHARNAGAIFMHKDKLIRPAQNCAIAYGDNISFNEITEISEKTYLETHISNLTIDRIDVVNSKKHFDGIHTYNTNYKYEVIDLRVKTTIQSAKFIGLLLNKIKNLLRK